MVGREGLIDSRLLLGWAAGSAEWISQLPGKGLRVPTDYLQTLFRSSEEFREAVLSNTQQQHNASTQLASCNVHHDSHQRLSRWLLTASSLSSSLSFPLPQEFLAQMLGVRRSTVSLVMGPLKERELISVRRGTIRILNQRGLIESACECYRAWRSSLHPSLLQGQTAPHR